MKPGVLRRIAVPGDKTIGEFTKRVADIMIRSMESASAAPRTSALERPQTPDGRARRVEAAIRAVALSPALIWSLVFFGVLVRAARFLSDRSLWLDESYLTLNLANRSYSGLVGTLDFAQGAPVGFLFLEKAVWQVLGDSEQALRLPSLVAGVASVAVFVDVARHYLPRVGVPFALFFFVVLEPFIYYSSEAKQYGFDVLVTLVLLALFARLADRPLTNRGAAVLISAGVVTIWFSHPAVFLLAAYGVVAAALALYRGDVRDLARQGVVYALWVASFVVEYLISIRHLRQFDSGHETSTNILQESYLKTLVKGLYTIFSDPGEQPRTLVGVTALAAAIGVVALWRRSSARTALLVAPPLVALGAGATHLYPLGVRFILFLLPIGVLLVTAGVVALVRGTRGDLRLSVAVVLSALLLAPPTVMTLKHAISPPDQEPAESLIARSAREWQRGDVLYLYSTSQYAFRYYLRCKECNGREQAREAALWPFRTSVGIAESSPAVISETPSLVVGGVGAGGRVQSYLADLKRLEGHARVWILILHVFPDRPEQLVDPLDQVGKQLLAVRRGVALLLLYDLRPAR